MKAKTKTILLAGIAILDCVFGGLIITGTIDSNKQAQLASIKSASNYVVVEDIFELNDSILDTVENKIEEQKRIIEEKEKAEKLALEKKRLAEQKALEAKKAKEAKIVYDGMTLNQLANKLNKSLKSDMSGKGYLIASYSLSKGVDPYVATAIILHETGCEWGCSSLVKKCNNVGGQKGSGCGSYAAFSSLDSGIKKFIDNLAKNYYSKGLNTPEKMNAKYAASKTWSKKVNSYVAKIKAK